MGPLALLALALPVLAVVTGPATKAPSSAHWGPDYKEKVQTVFDRLLKASGYDNPTWLARENRQPTRLIYSDKFQQIEGSPAVACPARFAPNENDYSVVAAGYGLLEFVHNEHELAFIFGHELAHLAGEHAKRLYERKIAHFDKWYEANEKRVSALSAEEVAKLFAKENQGLFEQWQRELEREADGDGLNLMKVAGYDGAQASQSLKRAQDWLWALGGNEPDKVHEPLWVRAKQLHEWNSSRKLREGSERALQKLGNPF